MTDRAYLRRPIRTESPHRRRVIIVAIASAAIFAFALLDTAGSVRETRLTREICELRAEIVRLRGTLSFHVVERGNLEERERVLARLEQYEGFVTPDSGGVMLIEVAVGPPIGGEREVARDVRAR
jgi:hypothetical protein